MCEFEFALRSLPSKNVTLHHIAAFFATEPVALKAQVSVMCIPDRERIRRYMQAKDYLHVRFLLFYSIPKHDRLMYNLFLY